MKTTIWRKNFRYANIMELARKLKELEIRTRVTHEIFFAMNLNAFKKYGTEGGK